MSKHELFAITGKIVSAIIFILAAIVLCGWVFGYEELINLGVSVYAMQANTSFCLMMIALALILPSSLIGACLGGIPSIAAGVLTLSEYLFDIDLWLDQQLIHTAILEHMNHPGRMGANTALAITCMGVALLVNRLQRKNELTWYIAALSVFAASIGAMAFFGHILNIGFASGWTDSSHMFFTTSVCIVAVSFSLTTTILQDIKVLPHKRIWLAALAISVVGFSVTILVWSWILSNQRDLIRFEIQSDSKVRAQLVQKTIDSSVDIIRSVERFFAASEEVTREEFRTYVNPLLLRNESLTAIDWSPRISQLDRSTIEALIGDTIKELASLKELDSQLKFAPRKQSDVYFPVVFTEPFEANRIAMGFDPYSDLPRKIAMERAKQEGQPIATSSLRLFRLKNPTSSEHDFLVFVPVYHEHEQNFSKKDIRGFLVGVFQFDNVIKVSLNSLPALGLDLSVEEDSELEKPLSITHNLPRSLLALQHGEFITLPGKRLRLLFTPTASYLKHLNTRVPTLVLILGSLITLFLSWYVIGIHTQHSRVQALVEELEYSKQLVERVTESSISMLYVYDLQFREFLFQSKPLNEFLGYRKKILTLMDTETLSNLIHGNDKKALLKRRRQYKTLTDKQFIDFELQVKSEEGDWHSVAIRERIFKRDIFGRPTQIMGSAEDVTLRKQAERALIAATESKSQFLANMSHEIRTPLTAIIGYAESLLVDDISKEERSQLLNIVLRNSKHLLGIISDILDLSKIEAGKVEVETISVPLFELLNDVKALMSHRAEDRALYLKFEYDLPIPRKITTDPTRLKQILINLIGNAVKFTKNGGVIVRVVYDQSANQLKFSVADTGIGLTDEQRSRLFQAFSQADTSTTRKFGGTGLGLVISYQLAIRLGGSMYVESIPDIGSTFTFTINPGKILQSDLEQEVPQLSPNVEEKPTVISIPQLQGKVLLVEDGTDNQRFISYIISKTGLSVEIATNGIEAVRKATQETYDLILMDMQMPVMDGYSATKELRQRGYKGRIVALTANIMVHAIERCIQAGCDGYLGKPFERHQIYSVLSNAFSKKIRTSPAETQIIEPIFPLIEDEDPEFVELIKLFVDRLPERIKMLEDLVSQTDWNTVQTESHKLKGAAFPFPELGKVAGALEQAAKEHDRGLIVTHLEALKGIESRIRLGVAKLSTVRMNRV